MRHRSISTLFPTLASSFSYVAFASLVACGGAATDAPPPASPNTLPSNSDATPAAAVATKNTATPSDAEANARAVVEAGDRSAEDRALDEGRHPAETLAFFGILPGMRVGEISAGFGYTTELLARAVGSNGKVYAENNRFILEKFAAKGWAERLAKPINKNVMRVDRELDDPMPPEAKDLDAVIDVLFYHDTFWMKTDRARMNANIFAALKHGGVYGIIDHSGKAGTGSSEVQTLHRIEEKIVRDEVVKSGFVLAGEAAFLRNPKDTMDWNASPRVAGEKRGTSDRFVLKFVKP
jgi:predicted methyltransferase